MSKTISIIDYGMSNLLSISRAFEHVGVTVKLVTSPVDILNADYLVLPGVGAFPDGMDHLNSRNFSPAIKEFASKGRPLLGICLGMQMLLGKGHEHNITSGLDIIPGEVLPLPRKMPNFKVPNINWHSIIEPAPNKWNSTILANTANETNFYFVHSYYTVPSKSESVLAISKFGALDYAAAIISGNVIGTQFHPEKSGQEGLNLLKKFTEF